MRLRIALASLALAAAAPASCWAWGATGPEWISGIAIEKLPDSVLGFVRTPEAAAEIAVMGRELDRSKGAGKTHDAERDPGHYVDLGDNGEVMGVAAGRAAKQHERSEPNTSLSWRKLAHLGD